MSFGVVKNLSRRRNWSKLHDYILGEVTDKLTIVDYIRFSAVCKSWRTVFLENPYKTPFLPGLVVPTKGTNSGDTCNFYSLRDNKLYQTPLRMPSWFTDGQFTCYGSSFGWLIASPRSSTDNYVQLINPFLSKNQTIDLPPLSTMRGKFVLSADPATAFNSWEIMGIFGRRVLVYFKPGRKNWVPIRWKNAGYRRICSIIFFKKTKQFYAVDCSGAVVTIKVGAKLKQVAESNPAYGPMGGTANIVESACGELLQVRNETYDDIKFFVYKLDEVTRKWIPMRSLGDHVLLLGIYNSSCLSASKFPACKRNCIYFMYYGEEFEKTPVLKVYNYEDGTTDAHYVFESALPRRGLIWVEPRVQGWV